MLLELWCKNFHVRLYGHETLFPFFRFLLSYFCTYQLYYFFSLWAAIIILNTFNSKEAKKIGFYEHAQHFQCGNNSMEVFLLNTAYFEHIDMRAGTIVVFFENRLAAYYTKMRVPNYGV